MANKILIVGGVAGGAGAAARLRRLSEEDEIIVFEKSSYISYANCGLPYYIGGVIEERNKLFVQTPEAMGKRFNLDIRVDNEVTKIDTKAKTVEVKKLDTGEVYTESFDKLVVSTGAKAFFPPIKGIETANNIFPLKTVEQTDAMFNYISDNNVKKALVIGGGFIGVETAENLLHRGVETTLIDMQRNILAGPADYEMAQHLHQELVCNGLNLILEDVVSEIKDNGKTVVTKNGEEIKVDMIVMSAGITPNVEILKDAGIKMQADRFVSVNDNFETSAKDVYAVGDIITVNVKNNKDKMNVPLAWPSNRQARLVADAIHGKKLNKEFIHGASIIKVFDKTFANVGITEKIAQDRGINYDVVYANRGSHAGYYPGATPVILKLVFNKDTGEILGAQGVGNNGVDKRIDVIATAMRFNAKVTDLSSIELCYAPPFNSAKDPVNILGYVAENVMEDVYKTVQWHEIDEVIAKGGYLLDVRTELECGMGKIEGSHNLGVDDIRDNLDKLPTDKNAPLYVTCQVGHRGYVAIRILQNLGYKNLYNLTGGYGLYKVAKMDFLKKKANNKQISAPKGGTSVNVVATKTVNACGMQCPGPLLETKNAVDSVKEGESIMIKASDPGFYVDVQSWCDKTGNQLSSLENKSGVIEAVITKGSGIAPAQGMGQLKDGSTIVAFSGDFDKLIAAMIIANGASAMGQKVSIFFTFWGLNALRLDKKTYKLNKKERKFKVKKTPIEKMFGKMMPRGANKTKLSQMHMAGMGTGMIKGIMNKHNVKSLPELIREAQKNGVKFIACTMSMELMGIKKEELMDGVEYAGVGAYIGDSLDSTLTLFI